MTFISGPPTTLDWVMLAAGLAAFAVFTTGLQKFFLPPAEASQSVAFIQESTLAVALIHGVGIISSAATDDAWTIAGTALYLFATSLFLGAVEVAQDAELPRGFVADRQPKYLVTGGVYRFVRHPVYLAASLAWLAGPLGTQSVTLLVTAIPMVAMTVIAARREDAQLEALFGDEYRAYRRWWR